MRDVLYGLIAGALGALLWALVAYWTDYEIGWVAWIVGLMVGYAVALGNQEQARPATTAGVLAVIIAALAIIGGKYLTTEMLMPADEELSAIIAENFENDEYVVSFVADEVAADFEAEGQAVEWPEGVDPNTASEQSEYPPEVWAEAEKRWGEMSASEQTAFREARLEESQAQIDSLRLLMSEESFLSSFTSTDFVFFGLAMVTAFGIGSGGRREEEQEPGALSG